jgi:hypothetical protein
MNKTLVPLSLHRWVMLDAMTVFPAPVGATITGRFMPLPMSMAALWITSSW